MTTSKAKKPKSSKRVTSCPVDQNTFIIGNYKLVRPWSPGKVWLINKDGEGMPVSEMQLSLFLDLLFYLEF